MSQQHKFSTCPTAVSVHHRFIPDFNLKVQTVWVISRSGSRSLISSSSLSLTENRFPARLPFGGFNHYLQVEAHSLFSLSLALACFPDKRCVCESLQGVWESLGVWAALCQSWVSNFLTRLSLVCCEFGGRGWATGTLVTTWLRVSC